MFWLRYIVCVLFLVPPPQKIQYSNFFTSLSSISQSHIRCKLLSEGLHPDLVLFEWSLWEYSPGIWPNIKHSSSYSVTCKKCQHLKRKNSAAILIMKLYHLLNKMCLLDSEFFIWIMNACIYLIFYNYNDIQVLIFLTTPSSF